MQIFAKLNYCKLHADNRLLGLNDIQLLGIANDTFK